MTKTHKIHAAVSMLLFAVLACQRPGILIPLSLTGTASTSAAPTPAAPTPAAAPALNLSTGQSTHTLTWAGLERNYILYVPASLVPGKPAPLVFVLHGGTGNAGNIMNVTGFNSLADQDGFIVVYPNGTGRVSTEKLLTWNGGDCCGYAQEQNIDDVGFVRAITISMQAQTQIDPKRIYATGFSNGAILSQRLACDATDLFAAVAPVSGTLNYSPCKPSGNISVIEFHGTGDKNILYNGGYGPDALTRTNFTSVVDTLKFWASFDGCSPASQMNAFADIQHQTWTGCVGSSAVELYTIVDGQHAWPKGSIQATALIWDFFAAHPKP